MILFFFMSGVRVGNYVGRESGNEKKNLELLSEVKNSNSDSEGLRKIWQHRKVKVMGSGHSDHANLSIF